MKRATFIIIGIILIIILFTVWIYSLVYGTPQKAKDVFANFGLFGGNNTSTVVAVPIATTTKNTPTVNVASTTIKLRQLTTRPVIGFREFQASSTEPKYITYAKAGTGHIYTINLTTGEEKRVSNVTVPTADKAVFSANGRFVAIRSGYTKQNQIILIDLQDLSNVQSEVLPYDMDNFTFSATDELEFTQQTNVGTLGRAYNPITKAVRDIFTVPFQASTVVWSPDGITPDYVYPKAASRLNGYLYIIKNGEVTRVPIDGKGLTAKANPDYIVFSHLIGADQQSFFYDQENGEIHNAPIILTPEKCIFANQNSYTLFCGYQIVNYTNTFPDEWYKGTRSFSDRIWEVNLHTQSATQLVSPPVITGRDIDINNMSIGLDDSMLYFTNKIDRTLWTYER